MRYPRREGRVALDVLLPAPRMRSLPIFRHWLKRARGILAWLRRWRLQRHIRPVAKTLLKTLQGAGMLAAWLHPEHIAISVTTREMPARLNGADPRPERLIIESLREIDDPLFPARYLPHRGDWVWRVPQVLSTNKALAVLYTRHRRRDGGRATLTYAHSERGKTLTLHARQRFLATAPRGAAAGQPALRSTITAAARSPGPSCRTAAKAAWAAANCPAR